MGHDILVDLAWGVPFLDLFEYHPSQTVLATRYHEITGKAYQAEVYEDAYWQAKFGAEPAWIKNHYGVLEHLELELMGGEQDGIVGRSFLHRYERAYSSYSMPINMAESESTRQEVKAQLLKAGIVLDPVLRICVTSSD